MRKLLVGLSAGYWMWLPFLCNSDFVATLWFFLLGLCLTCAAERATTYATDAEMAAAKTDLERRMALAGSDGRRRRILTSASKGL